MPELPEVETIRRDLKDKILNLQIKEILILDNRSLKGESVKKFKEDLEGSRFIDIERRGKLLIFKLSKKDKFLLVHLKMTGQLIYKNKKQIIAGGHSEKKDDFNLPNNHTRVIFKFSKDKELYFNDLRIFGYLKIVNEKQKDNIVDNNFGFEPLGADFTLENFKQILKNRKISIKALLLNQKLIAGIGNIYADETLFLSGVRPARRVDTLKEEEIKKLFLSIKKILKQAIEKRGTTFNNYVDSSGNKGNFIKYLKVYGRQGQKCKKCGSEIKKIKHAGRGTHYCPDCQK